MPTNSNPTPTTSAATKGLDPDIQARMDQEITEWQRLDETRRQHRAVA